MVFFIRLSPSAPAEFFLLQLRRSLRRQFGGVATLVVSDNLRSGITKACFYEPAVNRAYAEMAPYGAAVVRRGRIGRVTRLRSKLRSKWPPSQATQPLLLTARADHGYRPAGHADQ